MFHPFLLIILSFSLSFPSSIFLSFLDHYFLNYFPSFILVLHLIYMFLIHLVSPISKELNLLRSLIILSFFVLLIFHSLFLLVSTVSLLSLSVPVFLLLLLPSFPALWKLHFQCLLPSIPFSLCWIF